MTNRELIERLSALDPDMEVFHFDGEYNGSYSPVTAVQPQEQGTRGKERGIYLGHMSVGF